MIIIKQIYLDNASTTPLSKEMKQYIIDLLDIFYNPSNVYQLGQEVKQIIENTRSTVASFINCDPDEIFFTPGGSGSNTMAIQGYCAKHNCTVLYSPISHNSVLQCVRSCAKKSHPLQVDTYGRVNIQDLKEWMKCNIRPFVIVDYANSEIGTIQDVKQIIDLVHFYNGVVYLDCTGSIPTISINIKKLKPDMIGFSAHKLGGLKGCGVLYKNKNIQIEPLIYGSQENGLCAGTENVLGIASLGEVLKNYDYSSITSGNRDYVYDYIVKNIPDSYLVGASIESGNRLPHNLYMAFKGIEGESLLIMLDMNDIQVSTGSACASGNHMPSTALSAIGIDQNDIHSCIRMSFSGSETKDDLDHVCNILKQCVENLRKFSKYTIK